MEKHIRIVGTLMTNRRGIADEVKIVTNHKEFSQMIQEGKKDLTLCSYHVKSKSKGKRNVLMLTTMDQKEILFIRARLRAENGEFYSGYRKS